MVSPVLVGAVQDTIRLVLEVPDTLTSVGIGKPKRDDQLQF